MTINAKSLSWQMLSRCIGAIAICIIIAFFALYWAVKQVIDTDMDDDLYEDIVEFSVLYQEGDDQAVIDEINRETAGGGTAQEFLRLFDPHGTVIHSSDMHYWEGTNVDKNQLAKIAGSSQAAALFTISPAKQEADARVIVARIADDRVMQIGESFEARDEIMSLLMNTFMFVFLAALPLACLFGWLATRNATRGIATVSKTAQAIESGNLSSRVSVSGQPEEIQALATSFNGMADRVDGLVKDMREMTDNIAHDLRSPLGRIRAIAESALTGAGTVEEYRRASENSIAECDRLIKLINTSLDVAETEAGVARLTLEPIDLAELADEACELFDPVAENKNIRMTKDFYNSRLINGDRQSLLRMLVNLIDNAVKYTPANGKVRVAVNSDDSGNYLEVADSGIGIPNDEQSRIFDRFYRCDQSRTDEGCGLGLSFARAVARSHGGDINLLKDATYKTVFRVSFGQPSA